MELLKACYPATIQQFAGNRFLVRKIYEIASKGLHLVIFGPTGCGKTTLCRIFQTNIGYQSFFEVNKDTFTSTKELIANLKTFLTSKTIESFFNKSRTQRRAVFIDDYDILTNTDKLLPSQLMSEIFPLLDPYKTQLIITCITDHAVKKKLQDVLKSIESIKLSYPSPKEAFVHLLNELGDKIEGKEERLLELLTKYKGCIRDAMMHLDTPDDVEAIGLHFKDMNQFELVKALYTKPHITQKDIKFIMHNDIANVSYLMLENFPEELYFNRVSGDACQMYLRTLETFSTTAELETYAFNNAEWGLYDSANMIRLAAMADILNTNPSKPVTSRKDAQMRFTQLLSKMSHKNIFCKRLDNIKDKLQQNYVGAIKHIEETKGLKKNTDESNVQVTYMKYFSEIK